MVVADVSIGRLVRMEAAIVTDWLTIRCVGGADAVCYVYAEEKETERSGCVQRVGKQSLLEQL